MRKKTRELALCSMIAALSVVLLCLGGIVPLAVYACPMLASFALLAVREECRSAYSWCCWAAVALLAVLLCPDKEAAAVYCFLGYYPLLQPRLERIRVPVLCWLAKLLLAVVSMGTMYALLLYVFCLDAVVEEFADTAPALLWATVGLGLALFVIYDALLRRFTQMWRRRRQRQYGGETNGVCDIRCRRLLWYGVSPWGGRSCHRGGRRLALLPAGGY